MSSILVIVSACFKIVLTACAAIVIVATKHISTDAINETMDTKSQPI